MKDKAFTLVELLAVIIVLGIIIAIAVPSVNKLLNNSKKNAMYDDALIYINQAKLQNLIDNKRMYNLYDLVELSNNELSIKSPYGDNYSSDSRIYLDDNDSYIYLASLKGNIPIGKKNTLDYEAKSLENNETVKIDLDGVKVTKSNGDVVTFDNQGNEIINDLKKETLVYAKGVDSSNNEFCGAFYLINNKGNYTYSLVYKPTASNKIDGGVSSKYDDSFIIKLSAYQNAFNIGTVHNITINEINEFLGFDFKNSENNSDNILNKKILIYKLFKTNFTDSDSIKKFMDDPKVSSGSYWISDGGYIELLDENGCNSSGNVTGETNCRKLLINNNKISLSYAKSIYRYSLTLVFDVEKSDLLNNNKNLYSDSECSNKLFTKEE